MAMGYNGSQGELQGFADKFFTHVETMGAHMSVLRDLQVQFQAPLTGATGKATQDEFTRAIEKGTRLQNFLNEAVDALKTSGARVGNQDLDGSVAVGKSTNFNF